MDKEGLTIAEAAALLGVHKNTIRNRIKDGTYKAEKVITERGQTWLIERDSLTNLTNNTLPSGSQAAVSQDVKVALQAVLEPFVRELGDVREELGRERALREQAERRVEELEKRLEPPQNALTGPRNARETASEDSSSTSPSPQEEQRSWWRRFFGV